MKFQGAMVALISMLSLLMSCKKDSSKDSRFSLNSPQIKAVLLEQLRAHQQQADGLYIISDGLLRVGPHSVELIPVVESEVFKQGKNIVAMRIEVVIDGVQRPEANFGAIGIADTKQEAVIAGLGEWYLSFARPLFEAVGEKNPTFVTTDFEIFAGALGLRGATAHGWVDGSEVMNRKILDTVAPTMPRKDFVTLDLKVMVPSTGQPRSECRIDGIVSSETASHLVALDWPRTAEGYMFKQAFVVKRKKLNLQQGAN
jgi:hypothetical protein